MPPPPSHAATPNQAEPPLPSADLPRWFNEEVHRHESALRAYLHGSFPAVRDVDDVVQESYLRIWQARAARPIHSARGFLFRIARNLALDFVRRERTSPVAAVGDLTALPVVQEGPDAAALASTQEKIHLLATALVALPPVCRQVVMLRKLQNLSRAATATRLGIAEKTVDEHLARGLRKLGQNLRARGVGGYYET